MDLTVPVNALNRGLVWRVQPKLNIPVFWPCREKQDLLTLALIASILSREWFAARDTFHAGSYSMLSVFPKV